MSYEIVTAYAGLNVLRNILGHRLRVSATEHHPTVVGLLFLAVTITADIFWLLHFNILLLLKTKMLLTSPLVFGFPAKEPND